MTSWPHLSEALPQLARPDEVAQHFGWTADGVATMCRKGRLPAVKVGGRWFIHVKKLAEFLDVTSPAGRSSAPIPPGAAVRTGACPDSPASGELAKAAS